MAKNQEIERKFFLPNHVPEELVSYKSASRKCEIWQGYLPAHNGELRLRKTVWHEDARTITYTMTKKSEGTLVREEEEIKLPFSMFEDLKHLARDNCLEKVRYSITYGKLTLELDIYRDALAGLRILECEFPSVAVAQLFILPDWATGAIEVTDDKRFKNKNLAKPNVTTGNLRLVSV